ncbi:hypothetical protein KDH_69110 [Dictyobacter sp. S3.2.2.5]|uniref:Uncharacterized protein n=1 Tax=Dictyobacter halimunensis TaxID=3026934 RepID=A0ABQ6G641_9CHLR|nr:hypothetical protein KDH_69110 [Dictyobacter sp. S3.2.2.5]
MYLKKLFETYEQFVKKRLLAVGRCVIFDVEIKHEHVWRPRAGEKYAMLIDGDR